MSAIQPDATHAYVISFPDEIAIQELVPSGLVSCSAVLQHLIGESGASAAITALSRACFRTWLDFRGRSRVDASLEHSTEYLVQTITVCHLLYSFAAMRNACWLPCRVQMA